MEIRRRRSFLTIGLVGLLLGSFAIGLSSPIRAASVTINLYGKAAFGWGTSPGGETMPGPTLTVNKNDVVTMNLFSEDGLPHQFLLDYNGNGFPDPGEPESVVFSSSTSFTFTASQAGTFNYECLVHPMMNGTWKTVAPPPPTVHDLGVVGVSASPLTVAKGQTVTINVTVHNFGNVGDNATVTAFANAITIGTMSSFVPVNSSVVFTFLWDTTPVSIGNYTISASVAAVPGETNLSNNQMTDGIVFVTLPPPGNLKARLVGHSAWPDFHHLAIHSRGSTQTLFGKMQNIGPGPVKALVVFKIYNSAGSLVATVNSNVGLIPVGGEVVVSGTWTATPGRYHVVAQCWFDTNNDGYFDGSDPNVKTFSFAVVP